MCGKAWTGSAVVQLPQSAKGWGHLGLQTRVPGELIETQGDWASKAYLHYLEFSLSERCQVAQEMTLEIQKEGLWMLYFHCSFQAMVGAYRLVGQVRQGPRHDSKGLPQGDPDTAAWSHQAQGGRHQLDVKDLDSCRH